MESEDPCSCTPQDKSEYWESLKNQFEDQTIMLKAKELELREKIAQVESLIADQSSNSYSELSSDIPRVFPRRPESPERDVNPSTENTNKCPAGFFQKVMENAKSILTMKCSAIHPSNTASEEPTRETDSSCHCNSETQQSSKSTSSRAVSFETVPQPRGSSSEYCLCDKDSVTKNDTTADSYSQEVNNSFCCSVTCSSEVSRKEGYICSNCCLPSSAPSPSKQGSKGTSHITSTNVSRKACSCNTSRTQAVEKYDKLSEATVDTASRDTRMITSPCQICCKRRIKSQSDQQSEARIAFDTKPPGKTSACQVCMEIRRLAKLSDKQVEAQAATATKTSSTCRICRRSQSASEYSDKQIEAQAATSSKLIEAVSASVSRATRITNSSCRICLERRSQSASKATTGQFLTPEAAVASTSRVTRISGTTCSGCMEKKIKTEAEVKGKEKPAFVSLQSCWVNPLQSTAKRSVAREMMPSRDNAFPNRQEGDVSCTADTCPELVSRKLNVSPNFGDEGEKGGPCRKDTCPDFSGKSSGQFPCKSDTCPDFSGESSGQLSCNKDTCPDFSGESSRQLPCREDTCPDFSGGSSRKLPCREETCPDFGGFKRGPCRDDTCPVVTAITKSVTSPNVCFGKRTEKRKSTCSIGTCPSAKRVRSRSNIRDMDNQCAFIGSPVLNSSNYKGFGDTVDCCCCTDKEEPLPDTTSTEKCMKCHMQELLEREKNYDSVFQTFQNMANQPTYCCMAAVEKNHAQGDVRRITDELRLENQILKSELMELKYEMKQCLEKVEGPMKQKLQTEKCKCEKLQHELAKTSENMMASQDIYMREMNALKLQLCVACSNMTDLNAINKRLKEEMKSLDCMCSKLEDDLVKQKLNEADTIRMLTKRSAGFGDTTAPPDGTKPAHPCTPRSPKKPQETQSETFKCTSNLHVIARKLSKTLKESAPCEECSKLPELTGAAKLIKDLTDLVESRKIDRSSLDSMASRRDCACQSPPRTEDDWCQCNNFRDVGAGEFPVRPGVENEGGSSKPTETLFSASPTFAEKNESSYFGMKPTTTPPGGTPALGKEPCVVESRYYSAHDAPCPTVCDDKAPSAPIQRPCLVSKSETSPAQQTKVCSDQIPGKQTIESGTVPCVSFDKPCQSLKKEIDSQPERVFKETGTVPCPEICYSKEGKKGVGDKAAKEVTKDVPAETITTEKKQEQPWPPGVEPPAESYGATSSQSRSPCFSIGIPCQLPKGLEEGIKTASKTPTEEAVKEQEQPSPTGIEPPAEPSGPTSSQSRSPCFSIGIPCQLPKGLEEGIKTSSESPTEEAVRHITSILLTTVVTADSKEKTLVEPKDREVLPGERTSISSIGEAMKYITDVLGKNLAEVESSKEKPVVILSSKDRGLSPERVADEVPIEGTAKVPEKSSQKGVTVVEEVSENMTHEVVPIGSNMNLIAQVTGKEDKVSARVSFVGSHAGPGEEVLLEEIILDPELGDKPSAVTEEKPEVPGAKPSEDKPTEVSVDMVDKITQSTEKKLFEEIITGDLPFTVETQAVVLEEPPSGLHVTSTITTSGNLEVITEGPTGLIETTLTYGEDGTIEVITQITKLSQESLDTGVASSAATPETEVVPEKKRPSKVPGGATPSPDIIAKFDEEVRKLTQEAKQKDSILTGDSQLTGLETVSDYTNDTTAVSSTAMGSTAKSCTAKCSATKQLPKDKGTDSFRTDTVTQQTSQVHTNTKCTSVEIPGTAATSTDEKSRKESEVVSSTATGEVAVSSHVVSCEKATTEATERSEITVKTSPISTKDTATESVTTKESTRQQTSIIETAGQSTESEPAVTEATTQDTCGARSGEGFGKEEGKTPSRSWQTEESDERTNVSDIAEDAPFKPVKQAAISQKRDSACQSSTPAEQSCQCCDCKDVGVSTSQDNDTNTETKMTIQKLPVKKSVADGDPKSTSNSVYGTVEGTRSSRGDTAEASSLQTGKTQGTSDEMSTLNEESQLMDTKYSDAQDKSSSQMKRLIASGEPQKSLKPTDAGEQAQTAPIQQETSSKPSESYKSLQEIKSSATRDTARGKHSSGSDSEDEKKRKSLENAETKRKRSSEVPDSVSKLSDKDKPPLLSSSEGKRQKKKRSPKLDLDSCDCPGVCQCVVCSPDIIAKRKAITGTSDPPDRQSEKLCCCTYPQPAQRTQAVYMQVSPAQTQEPTHHQPGCPCCCPPRTEAFLRSTNIPVYQDVLPKNRRRTSLDDVFQPTEDPIDQQKEAPSKKLPHARSCECIDCLCLPTIHKIAEMREFPVVKDEKQIYQVSTIKCECINAINAKKLALERSRIPIATHSNASPPKVRVSTQAACTCDECRCSPCGDHSKVQPVTQAGQVASQLGGGTTSSQPRGSMTLSEIAKLCDCGECDCSICFNKPAPVTESTAQEPCDQPEQTKSATPTPSVRIDTKNCCCKGECTCKPCPVDDDKVKEAPSKISKKESEKLTKASLLAQPEDCDCDKCVCPMGTESAPQDAPSEPQDTLSAPQDMPSAPQNTTSAPQEPPHPEDCDCVVCACPESPAKLPSAASKMSKAESTSKPPAETQPGSDKILLDCDCDTCHCPGTEDCTCVNCVCPGADTMKPAVLQTIPEKVPIAECDCDVCECSPCADPKKRKPAAPAQSHPVPCDCPKCECEPCADPSKRSEAPAPVEISGGDVKAVSMEKRDNKHLQGCTCDVCECPGKDKVKGKGDEKQEVFDDPPICESKNKAPEPHPDDCICTECLCSEETSVPVKVPHPDNCECPECLCLEEVMVTASDFSQGVGVASKDTETHRKCPEDATQTEGKLQHGDGCKCPECQCVECYVDRFAHALECQCGECLCTDCPKIGQEGKTMKGVKSVQSKLSKFNKIDDHKMKCACSNEAMCEQCYFSKNIIEYKECKCGVCYCQDCAYMAAGAETVVNVTEAEGTPVAPTTTTTDVVPSGSCHCIDCQCDICTKEKPKEEMKAAESVKTAGHPETCTCLACMCIDCFDKTKSGDPVKSVPGVPAASAKEEPTLCPTVDTQICSCGDCTCFDCAFKPSQQTQPSASPEKAQGDHSLPYSEKKIVDDKLVDPPPFETPSRKPCDCDTCPCVICSDKRQAFASALAAVPAGQANTSPPAQGDAPPFEVPIRLPCNCVECTCPGEKKGPGDIPCADQKSVSAPTLGVSAPATAEAPFFEVPLRLPCACAICTCPSCNKEGGKPQTTLQSAPTVSVNQKENIPDRPFSAPGSARPVSRIHCECPTCVCPENPMDFQAGQMLGNKSTEIRQVSGQPSQTGGPSSVHCVCPTCQCPNFRADQKQSALISFATSVSSQKQSTLVAQPSNMSAKQSAPVAAQTSQISGKPSNQVAAKIPDCDCPTCVCSPCPDVQVSRHQQQVRNETHPDGCACPRCCACDARMAAIDLTRLNDEALEKKIQEDKKENCECREQIKEIRKALTKIKCACTEAEMKALKSKPLVKQASTFGQTMSGLKLALTNLQEKCKAKDKMINAMTGELKQRTSSKTFDRVLNKSISDAPDYDKAGDVKSSDATHEVSTNVLYTVGEERDTGAKGTFDAKLSRAMETEKKKKKSSKSCRCGKSHKSKDPQNIDLSGFEIVDIRRITQDSIIIKWKPPRGNSITGYDIYINGVNKSKVMSGGRTSAMIHSLDLSVTIQVTIYAVTKCGRCEPPAIAIYEVRP